jgi:hypothetical protein
MKPTLFRILVVLSLGILPFATNESFAARGGGGHGGGGGRGGGGGQPSAVAVGEEDELVGWEEEGVEAAGPRSPAEVLVEADPGAPPGLVVPSQREPCRRSGSEQECVRRKHQPIPSLTNLLSMIMG